MEQKCKICGKKFTTFVYGVDICEDCYYDEYEDMMGDVNEN